ncbi:MAG: S1C family serine protease [Planctomycetota bacterium]|jgi:serine protease Do
MLKNITRKRRSHKGLSHKYLCALVLLFSYSICCADKIVLKEGQIITGDILVEKQTQLYIDIGITVLTIPKEKILEYKYTETTRAEDIDVNDVNDQDAGKSPSSVRITSGPDQLYKTANLKKTTIEKCVDAVSEAVVKISSPTGTGSGFFINEDGFLITNYHVIEKETKIEVTMFQKAKNGFEKKKFKKVKIEAINPFIDLALLKVEDLGDTKLRAVYLGDIGRIKTGEDVFAIGNPLGLERTVTNGVISTKNRAFEGLIYIQTNADINPGNSGGPLFNLARCLIWPARSLVSRIWDTYSEADWALPYRSIMSSISSKTGMPLSMTRTIPTPVTDTSSPTEDAIRPSPNSSKARTNSYKPYLCEIAHLLPLFCFERVLGFVVKSVLEI